jgi:hypothetical protein
MADFLRKSRRDDFDAEFDFAVGAGALESGVDGAGVFESGLVVLSNAGLLMLMWRGEQAILKIPHPNPSPGRATR